MSSSVFRWPDRQQVESALEVWARTSARSNRSLRQVGYFGSYARGEWGVGSDLDVVIVVDDDPTSSASGERGAAWDVSALPVPADLLVYTESEWRALLARGDRFAGVLKREVVWVYIRDSPEDRT